MPPGSDTDSASESGDSVEKEVAAHASATEDTAATFVVDTTPSPVVFTSQASEITVENSNIGDAPLGAAVDDDVIVYEAPHPRLKRDTFPTVPASASSRPATHGPSTPPQKTSLSLPLAATPIDAVRISLVSEADPELVLSKQVQARKKIGLKPTPRSRKMAKKARAAARRREARMTSMTSYGLSIQEQTALQEGSTIQNDSRYAERRRGDSDLDWGTDDERGIKEVLDGIGDMDLDGDIGDMAALTNFARGVEGLAGEVTIADLNDAARMREEDEEDEDEGSPSEDDVFDEEEKKEIGEGSDVDGEEDSDMEIGSKARSSWADRDEDYIEDIDVSEFHCYRGTLSTIFIQTFFDEHADILHGRDRKARNALFNAIEQGEFSDDYEASIPLSMSRACCFSRDVETARSDLRKKDRVIPSRLRDRWERDRAKKAELKRIRALSRMQAAADLSPMRKSSKRKEKVLGGARFLGNTLYVDRVADMNTLEQFIRTFLATLELDKMVLPPKGKEWRKRAHSVALAFNLRSKSEGKGDGRFITLIKTTKSGVNVNQRKVSRLINGDIGEGNAPERGPTKIRPRDGDEVGKMAPRLSNSNVGFKLLQQMG